MEIPALSRLIDYSCYPLLPFILYARSLLLIVSADYLLLMRLSLCELFAN